MARFLLTGLVLLLSLPAFAAPTTTEVKENAEKAFDELDREAGARPRPAPKPKPAAAATPAKPASPPRPTPPPAAPPTEPAATKPSPASEAPEPSTTTASLLVPRYFQTASLPAGAAAQLTLEDGASLSVPAGALAAAAKASLERLDLKSAADDSVRVYDVRVQDASLAKPALLVLPLEGEGAASLPEILHYDSARRRWERLRGTLAADNRSVAVELKSFSPVVISQAGPFERLAGTMTRRPPVAPLQVPYYYQGDTMWCWAAALSMLEGFRGRATKIWELAAYYGVGPHEGIYIPAPRLNAYLGAKCPDCKSEYKVFYRQGSVDAYMKSSLDQGRPVWLDIPAAVHAVVAVGYDAENIYVHEPSGALIAQTSGVGALGAAYSDQYKGLPLAAYAIPWNRWDSDVWDAIFHNLTMTDDTIHWQGGRLNPVRLLLPTVYAISLSAPSPANKPLSISLFPNEQAWKSFSIAHSARDNPAKAPVTFHWDGRLAGGATFRHPLDKDGTAGMLCNGDSLEWVQPFLSNSADKELTAELRLLFDGKQLAAKTVTAAPRLGQVPVKIEGKDFSSKLRLVDMPVTLGEHELAVEAWSAGRLVDRAALPVKVAPASVTGVKAREDEAGELLITWDANPEESFKDAELTYRIVRSPGYGHEDEKVLGDTEPGQHRFKVPASEKKPGQSYSVWARDRKSGLTSQYAVYRQPEKDAPAASDDWVLVETSFEVWDGKTMDEGRRVFSNGRSAETPSKLSRWSIGPEEFSFFNSSTQFKSSARWDKMPEKLQAGKSVRFSAEALIEGLQSTQVGFGPVGSMCEWSIKMTNSDPAVSKLGLGLAKCDGEAPPPFHRIDLAGGADKPKVQSAKFELELAVRKTAATEKARPGQDGLSLLLELNAGNLAKVHWTFQKAPASAGATKP